MGTPIKPRQLCKRIPSCVSCLVEVSVAKERTLRAPRCPPGTVRSGTTTVSTMLPQRMEQCQSAAERAETVAEPRWPLRLIYPAFWELRFCLRGPGFGREGIEEKVNDRP